MAQPAADFAKHQQVTVAKTKDVYGLAFRHNGTVVDKVTVGKYMAARGMVAGLVLVACDNKGTCQSQRYPLYEADHVQAVKVIDLAGKPTSLNGLLAQRAQSSYRKRTIRRMRWPVLVLKTRWAKAPNKSMARTGSRVPPGGRLGAKVRNSLIFVSLRRSDFHRAVLFRKATLSRGFYGHGKRSTFKLVRGKGNVLDLDESRRRQLGYASGCLRPKPTRHRHVFNNRRYREQRVGVTMRSGCR